MAQLGKIKEVPLREVWKHEQYDFSEWLSKEENINELGEILHLNLVDVETEKAVGSYSCDIVCKDDITGKIVLIENQLEPTNHDHLGKIITYASGLDASVVVWVVEKAREEHASAIEWLNKHIDADISFFLIEIHAIKIGDSLPAPMFKIIEQPNDFSQQVKEIKKDGLNKSEEKRLEFWSKLNEVIEEKGKPINIRKPSTNAWYGISGGSTKCHINLVLVNQNGHIRVELWIPDCKEQYDAFFNHKEEIEESIGNELLWERLDENKACRISCKIDGLDFDNQNNYRSLMEQAINKAVIFKNTFKKYFI